MLRVLVTLPNILALMILWILVWVYDRFQIIKLRLQGHSLTQAKRIVADQYEGW